MSSEEFRNLAKEALVAALSERIQSTPEQILSAVEQNLDAHLQLIQAALSQSSQGEEEKEKDALEEILQGIVKIEYSVFQDLIFSLTRNSGADFSPGPQPRDGYNERIQYYNFVVPRFRELLERIKNRTEQLGWLQTRESTAEPESEAAFRVGNVVLVLQPELRLVHLIGGFSAEVGGDWKGGRINHDNFIRLHFATSEALNLFVNQLNSDAKAHEQGTKENYLFLMDLFEKVIPANKFTWIKEKVFRRLEIQEKITL